MITLDEATIRGLVGLGADELNAIEAVYPLIASGAASMPPIQRIDVPEHHGEIDIKSAYLPGVDGIAVKVSAGFFDNPQIGLPSLGGLMLVFSSTTGVPEAVLLDNGYLTNIRTALAGAVAAKHLSRPDAATVGVIGAGVQARLQIEALRLVRPITHVRVWARRADAAGELAEGVRDDTGLDVSVVKRPADVAVDGGIVVTTTPAMEPLLDGTVRRNGLHVTAVGSDAEHKQELSVDLVAAADRFVCDSRAQSERLGELRAPREAGRPVDGVELGDVISGSAAGRSHPDDVTICDLTGTGAQDTAIASLVVARSRSTS
ncbi:cyclodeaminase [Ilumatobacter nonamiensis]|uniref:cyclodeaminase n=1 Tax=Ilumatobacter nonamiensis TaxID=467093 RepID=UPI00034DDA2A|nr:cyclodeaminase [Ilumatobacter nonamiensis]